jgi:hypothetical protein
MQTESLYIGNATRQPFGFQYRVSKGASAIREQSIPSGEQIRVAGELTPAQVDYIVTSLAKYGVVSADSIDHTRGFRGYCYSIGKPIAGMKLTLLMDHNLGELVKLGREIREQSAIAQNNMLETALIENGRPERMTEMELTIQEENHDGNNDVPQFSEGFRVIRNENPTPRSNKGSRRRAA